jgi:uncharacterized protein
MFTSPTHSHASASAPPPLAAPPQAHPLTRAEQREVLAFLAQRPVHTVALTSMIRDHGMSSPLLRGRFYGVRGAAGRLEGVALIGHAALIEARTDRALAAFAQVVRSTPRKHLLMGERERVARFWQHFTRDGRRPAHFAARESLFTLTLPAQTFAPVAALRPARPADLDLIVPVQARLALAESGVDPLLVDPEGFRARCLRRIEQGRTWVVVKDGRLLFKTELQAVTPEVIYLEGVYVHEAARGQGFGTRCLSQLCTSLLERTKTISLLVNEQHTAAHSFYRKVGFRQQGCYDTIFFAQP